MIHCKKLVSIATLALAATAGPLMGEPSAQTFFTDFDSGNVTTLGEGDNVATFEDGMVGTLAIGRLYHSGAFSWMVSENTTGTITFSTPADVVEFYIAVQTEGDGQLRVFNGNNEEIANETDLPTSISVASGTNFKSYTHESGIGRIEVINLQGNGTNRVVIDDFGFSPAQADPGIEFTFQPTDLAVPTGARAQFIAVAKADSGSEVAYQWRKDGMDIAGETSSTLVIDAVAAADTGDYTVVAMADGESVESDTATLSIDELAFVEVTNLSTRAEVGAGDSVLIPGFFIFGQGGQTVLFRALGPELQNAPEPVENFLADPMMRLFNRDDEILVNDDWDDQDAEAIIAASETVNAPQLTEGSTDSAMLVTLPQGLYSVTISGADGGTGVALFEIFIIPEL